MQASSRAGHRPAPAITRFAVTRPWVALTAWLAMAAALAAIGLGIDGRLSSGTLQVEVRSRRVRAR